MYEKGISFLLESPSISFYLMDVICNPRLFICTDDRSMISDAMIDACLLVEMSCNDLLLIENLHKGMKYLHTVETADKFFSNTVPNHHVAETYSHNPSDICTDIT